MAMIVLEALRTDATWSGQTSSIEMSPRSRDRQDFPIRRGLPLSERLGGPLARYSHRQWMGRPAVRSVESSI